jgi:hypothetical protein
MERGARACAREAGLVIVAILALCLEAAAAHAQFEIKSPVVEKGVLELEALGSVQSRFNDDGDDEAKEGIELGFLFGLTDATADNTFKFNLEYEWGPGGDDDKAADEGDDDGDGDDD